MTDPVSLADFYAEIGTQVQDALSPDHTPLFLRSAPLPTIENQEEWVSFEVLGMDPAITPKLYVNQELDVQITCYSLHSQYRKDQNPLKHLEMSDKIKPLIDRRSFTLNGSMIEFLEARVVNLDLRSMGDFSKSIYQQSPKLNTVCIVLLSKARIIDLRT